MVTALRWASRSLNTPSKFASIKLLMISVMVNPPSNSLVVVRPRGSQGLWEQAERLVEADVVDGVPVFGRHTGFDAEKVRRGEVDGQAAGGDGAVPDADRCHAVVLGHHVRLHRQPSAIARGRSPNHCRSRNDRRGSSRCLDVVLGQGAYWPLGMLD